MTDKLRLEFLLSAIDKVTAPLKQISAGSNATSRALKAARDQLKELNAQQSNISSYTRQKEAVRQSSEELAKAQDKLRGLREQLQKMDAPTAAFQKAFVNASASVEKLTNKHTAQRSELQRLIPLMKSTGADTRNLGTTERRLKTEIEAANKAIQNQRDRLSALAKQQERVSKAQRNYSKGKELAGNAAVAGASAGAVGAATGLPIIGMVKDYSRFEDAMAGVAKQVEGARDGNGQLTQTYYDMGAAIKKMSETIPMATTDIAALVEGGARMGIQGKDDLLEFARVAATAATAFDLPAQEVGENLARIANLYKLPIKNVNQLGDAINFLDDNAMSKGGEIIDVMQRTAGITASVGMSFKDAAALGSTFLTLGASAETAGSATNAMIRELAIATKQPKRFVEGLKAIGLEAQSVQDGMAKDATGTIQKVLDAVNKLPKNQQLGVMTELFGKEYGDDAAKLAANMSEYRRQLELVNGADNAPKRDGSMQREGDIRGDQLSARWEMSQNRMFNLSSALGETLRPALIQLITGFNGVLERVNAWATANPGLVLGILKVGAGIAALSIGFSTVALALATTLGPFLAVRYGLSLIGIRLPSLIGLLFNLGSKVLPFVGQAFMWVGRLFMANPIGLAITAIAAAAYLIYANWDKVKAYFIGAWAEIKLGFSGGISGILQTLANFSPIGLIYQAFSAVMNYMGVEMPSRFTEFGGMIIAGLVNGITNAMGAVKTAISDAGSNTVDWFKEKLGIHSPSRVFAELGGFTMAGLAQGVAEGQSGPLEAVKAVGELMTQAGTVTIGAITDAGAALNPAAAVPGVAAAALTPAAAVPEAAAAALRPSASTPAAKAASGGMLDSILGMGKRLVQVGAMAVGMGPAQGVAEGQSGHLEVVKAMGELVTRAGTVTLGAITNAGALLNPAAAVPTVAAAALNPATAVPVAAAAALKPAASVPGAKAESGGILESIMGMGKRLAQVSAIAVGMGGAQGAIAVDNRPPIGPAAAPAAMQMAPDKIVINIHPAPGMDAAAIARAVSAELDKRQHAKQAKGRSALFDQE
ncbi:phage tail tape measure protein [Pseudomonas sp. UYIF39]|uniref:phage tail tape measure protein n=1 Tax=Pseudomonas sp. UYIF39 TaxID=1630747 RepID=UPI00249DD53D|nr:phage tail tape measure protein [Pseudomonas sp. UYIF39]MDI3355707.1 phage tail tape measure protein [Pseudomonas sp. UYIF39]